MEYACREGTVDAGSLEDFGEVLLCPGASGGNQGHHAGIAYQSQLLAVIALTHTVLVHAVQDYLANSTVLRLADPVEGVDETGLSLPDGVEVAG